MNPIARPMKDGEKSLYLSNTFVKNGMKKLPVKYPINYVERPKELLFTFIISRKDNIFSLGTTSCCGDYNSTGTPS